MHVYMGTWVYVCARARMKSLTSGKALRAVSRTTHWLTGPQPACTYPAPNRAACGPGGATLWLRLSTCKLLGHFRTLGLFTDMVLTLGLCPHRCQ